MVNELTKEEAKSQFDYWTNKLDLKHTFSFDEVYNNLLKKREYRSGAIALEEHIKSLPNGLGEDPFPLVHKFADGMYIRQIAVPAQTLTVTKIHKQTHPFFLLKGTISILTEEGVKKFTAPYSGITKVGTKRIIFHHDEVVFTTVHATKETDIDKIEDEVIAKNFDEIDDKDVNNFIELMKEEYKCLS